jgi:exopolysaccharide production protein ExoY
MISTQFGDAVMLDTAPAKGPGEFARLETGSLSRVNVCERIAAAAAMVALAPAGFVLAAFVFILSGRSPLVRHIRVGWLGAPLAMLKFRTMWEDVEHAAPGRREYRLVEDVANRVPAIKSEGDERVTSALAAFCRRYSIDELPQLWHVAKGEMSLVGPRPITAGELSEYYGAAATAHAISVRPGMTGLWQSMGRSRLTYPQRRRLDLFYVRHASAGLYFQTLLRSVPAVLKGKGAC